MTKDQNKPYDLEDRTLEFAQEVIRLCKKVPRDVISLRVIGQLVDSAGSVGANYREANEALSKKDFVHRMKISRKECKESSQGVIKEIQTLIGESKELRNIFTSIIEKSSK